MYARSPYPHALIRWVDTTRARAVPGVRAVLTGADLPPFARFGRRLQDWPVLARDRVRFIGDRVAAVAAETRQAAERAAALVDVDYAELPAVTTPEQALADGAPLLHPDADQYTYLGGERPPVPHPNVQGQVIVAIGSDAERAAAFAGAHRVFEHTFTTPRQHQGYIEPHACAAWIEPDGTVRVVSTNKTPFTLRAQMAHTIGVAEEQIVVDSAFIGGDFGGKGTSFDEYTCYFLAKATGRPVRAEMRYADELGAGNPRHAATFVCALPWTPKATFWRTSRTSSSTEAPTPGASRWMGWSYAARWRRSARPACRWCTSSCSRSTPTTSPADTCARLARSRRYSPAKATST